MPIISGEIMKTIDEIEMLPEKIKEKGEETDRKEQGEQKLQ